jgi:hypothetical protein
MSTALAVVMTAALALCVGATVGVQFARRGTTGTPWTATEPAPDSAPVSVPDADAVHSAAQTPVSEDAGSALFVESVGTFASDVAPVWSGQVESSRRQMEQAVGSIVQRFGRIVQLLTDTLDVTNHGVGQGHEQVVDRSRERLEAVLATLDTLVARPDADASGDREAQDPERLEQIEQQREQLASAAAAVRAVVDELVAFGQTLRQSSERLELTSLDVQQEIAESLVQLQFQDRIGQTLEHVRDGIDAFAPLLERARAGGTGAPAPLDTEHLLELLRSSYTMAEEHELHGAGVPVPVHDTEITFF